MTSSARLCQQDIFFSSLCACLLQVGDGDKICHLTGNPDDAGAVARAHARAQRLSCVAAHSWRDSLLAVSGRRGASGYTTPLLGSPGSITLTLRCVLPTTGGSLGTLEFFHEVYNP